LKKCVSTDENYDVPSVTQKDYPVR